MRIPCPQAGTDEVAHRVYEKRVSLTELNKMLGLTHLTPRCGCHRFGSQLSCDIYFFNYYNSFAPLRQSEQYEESRSEFNPKRALLSKSVQSYHRWPKLCTH